MATYVALSHVVSQLNSIISFKAEHLASEIAEVVVNCLYIEIDLIYFIRLINYDIIV